MPNMIDLLWNGFIRSARLANKPRQNYGLFDTLSLAVIGACDVADNSHIFITRKNKTFIDILMKP